ncbi:hypothetical protein NLI96_g11203 [Meripilus lineatus]|uniref:Uncharacterized protein n=1 Tax=Meripilus lineatus TaxID=2056292 RepID=A0AAD5US66_9APHY|nr:hypothetical protein NLI96_g11203 [Physisporinus lineatus]
MPSHKTRGVSRRVRQTVLMPYPSTSVAHSAISTPNIRNLGQRAIVEEREKALQRGKINTQGLSDQSQQALAELSGNPFNESAILDSADHPLFIYDQDSEVTAENEPLMCAIRDLAAQENWRSQANPRTWAHRRHQELDRWGSIMEPLIDGYLRWLSSTTAITIPTTPPPSIDESAHYLYTVFIFNIFLGLRSVTLSRRSDSLSLTLDFIAQGILVKTPTSPNVGIAIKTLELFYRIQLQKPSMSAEAFAKILCDYHKVDQCIHKALSWDTPNCLKRMAMIDGREVSDHRILSNSDYFIPRAFVNSFANEVSMPVDSEGYQDEDLEEEPAMDETQGGDLTDGEKDSNVSDCARNWKAAAADDKKKMWEIFDESGVFMSACRHGLILWIIDMIKSGELAKYPLATLAKIIEILDPDSCGGFDMSCRFRETVIASCLAEAFRAKNCTLCVNAFHGYTHAYLCQLLHHPSVISGAGLEDFETMECVFSASNQLAPITHYTTAFQRQLLVEFYFKQWDEDKYHNYCQALEIIEQDTIVLNKVLKSNLISEARLDDIPSDYEYTGPEEAAKADNSRTLHLETKQRHANDRYNQVLMEVMKMELRMGTQRWQPSFPKYQATVKYIAQRKYHRALNKHQQNLQALALSGMFWYDLA